MYDVSKRLLRRSICNATTLVTLLAIESQLDRVTLHLIVKRRALDAEDLRGFFLVPVALGQRLDDGVPLHVVEALRAAVVECCAPFVAARPATALPPAILSPRSCSGARAPPRIPSRFAVRARFPATSNRAIFEKLPERFPVPALPSSCRESFQERATSGGISSFRSRNGGISI